MEGVYTQLDTTKVYVVCELAYREGVTEIFDTSIFQGVQTSAEVLLLPCPWHSCFQQSHSSCADRCHPCPSNLLLMALTLETTPPTAVAHSENGAMVWFAALWDPDSMLRALMERRSDSCNGRLRGAEPSSAVAPLY